MTAASEAPPGRVEALSYFFPAHNEAENIEALVSEALADLGDIAERFDLVVTTPQYRLAEHPRVLQNSVTLHRVSAARLAADGAAVTICGRTEAKLEDAAKKIAAGAGKLRESSTRWLPRCGRMLKFSGTRAFRRSAQAPVALMTTPAAISQA